MLKIQEALRPIKGSHAEPCRYDKNQRIQQKRMPGRSKNSSFKEL